MSAKRARYTSNTTSVIVGKIHRRVFKNVAILPTGATGTVISATGDFSFGSDSLPRRPGFIWAQEIVKINFQWQSNDTYLTKPGLFWAGVSTNNAAQMITDLNTTVGPTYGYRRDEVIAVSTFNLMYQGPTAAGGSTTYPDTAVHLLPEDTVDMTDLMGQGVLVFGNNLYLIAQNYGGASCSGYVACEVWFKYVEVPLEYYLSTQQDQAASGI